MVENEKLIIKMFVAAIVIDVVRLVVVQLLIVFDAFIWNLELFAAEAANVWLRVWN